MNRQNDHPEPPIDRMARELWHQMRGVAGWPQNAVAWERMTDLGRDALRKQAELLLEAYRT